MRFQKINDNVIRCFITREEMVQRGVEIEDLMADRSKAEEFLRYILQQAHYELDFNASGEALNVQMSVMQDGDISLMISDDQNMAIRAMLEQLRERLKLFQNQVESQTGVKAISGKPVSKSADAIIRSTRKTLEEAGDDDMLELPVWAELDDIDSCIALAKALAPVGDVVSGLYRYGENYYMLIDFVQTKRNIAGNIFTVSEYSNHIMFDGEGCALITEHGERIIENNALSSLRQLAG